MVLKKRSKGLKFLLSFFLLAGWAFQSCTDEGIIDAPTWHQTVGHGDNALIRYGMKCIITTMMTEHGIFWMIIR